MSRDLLFVCIILALFLFSGTVMAAKTAKVSEMEQMESSLLKQQMKKIEKTEETKRQNSQLSLPPKQKEQVEDSAARQVNISCPLAIETHGTDLIGQKLALLLKESFNKSSFFLTASKKEKRILLRVNTLNEFTGRPGLSTIYVFTWLFSESEETLPYFLDNFMGTVDSLQLEKCAQQVLMQTTDVMEKFNYLF